MAPDLTAQWVVCTVLTSVRRHAVLPLALKEESDTLGVRLWEEDHHHSVGAQQD